MRGGVEAATRTGGTGGGVLSAVSSQRLLSSSEDITDSNLLVNSSFLRKTLRRWAFCCNRVPLALA